MPEFKHVQGWISAAHVPDEFPLCFRMLVWMAVRPPELTGQGCRTSIPALLPVLCYTLVHERYGLLSPSCGVVTQL